jgi:hypothetical protein
MLHKTFGNRQLVASCWTQKLAYRNYHCSHHRKICSADHKQHLQVARCIIFKAVQQAFFAKNAIAASNNLQPYFDRLLLAILEVRLQVEDGVVRQSHTWIFGLSTMVLCPKHTRNVYANLNKYKIYRLFPVDELLYCFTWFKPMHLICRASLVLHLTQQIALVG